MRFCVLACVILCSESIVCRDDCVCVRYCRRVLLVHLSIRTYINMCEWEGIASFFLLM